jgi:hypothetical protein
MEPRETLALRHGTEQQFFVNHIGHFALVSELAGLLRDGSGRVVILSGSAAGAGAPGAGIMFDNLAGQRFYKPEFFEQQSKFANALYAKELSRRLKSRSVAVNSVDPGTIGVAKGRSSLAWRLAQFAARPFQRSPAQGAATLVLLAASPSTAGVSGQYWRHCKVVPGNALLEDTEMSARLWNLSEGIIAQHRASRAPLPQARTPYERIAATRRGRPAIRFDRAPTSRDYPRQIPN